MILGIDLGTTFSVAAFVDSDGHARVIDNRDGERMTPSVVMFENGEIVVGAQAKENSVLDPYNVCQFVKRQMGRKAFSFDISPTERYTAEEISAMILKRLKEDAETAVGEKVEGAVITVPAYFDDAQRKATQDAGQIAGLKVLGILNEPTAAAIAYCHQNEDVDGNIMVFDLGGGTFDITIMRMSGDLKKADVLATEGNRNLGGFDFDNCIMMKAIQECEEKYGIDLDDDDEAMQELRMAAERAKKALSNRKECSISVASEGKKLKVDITREEFENRIHGLIESMQGSMEIALEEAGLSWGDISRVLLVGGSTRVPAVWEMICRVSGREPRVFDPDMAVALGAAYYADSLHGESMGTRGRAGKKISVADVNAHSLGVIAFDEEGVERMSIVLPKNTPLHQVRERTFTTCEDGQTQLLVRVMEGEDEEELEFDRLVGTGTIELTPRPQNSPIEVAMRYDDNGIIHIRVKDLVDGQELGEMRSERASNLTDSEVEARKNRMEGKTVE